MTAPTTGSGPTLGGDAMERPPRCPVCLTWHGTDEPHERASLTSMVIGYSLGLVALGFAMLVLDFFAFYFGCMTLDETAWLWKITAVPLLALAYGSFVGYGWVVARAVGASHRISQIKYGRIRWTLATAVSYPTLAVGLGLVTHTPWALIAAFAPGLLIWGRRTLLLVPAVSLVLAAVGWLLNSG